MRDAGRERPSARRPRRREAARPGRLAGRRRGVALVAALLTGLALVLLATAAATVALLDLQGARYGRAAQQARAAARSGVELAQVRLAAYVREHGALPGAPPPLDPPPALDAAWGAYRRLDDGACEVEIVGRAGGAVATAGARLRFR